MDASNCMIILAIGECKKARCDSAKVYTLPTFGAEMAIRVVARHASVQNQPLTTPISHGEIECVFFADGQCFAEFEGAGLCVLILDGTWAQVVRQ